MLNQRSQLKALVLGLALLTASTAFAAGTPYRVQGPLDDFMNANDRLGDTDLFWNFLDDQRGENLFEPDTITDIARARQNPDSFKGVQFLFIGRFNSIGSMFNPFYTHFTAEEYVNFSVWGQHTQLWTQEGVLNDFPYCYIRNTHSMIDRFLSLERLDTVMFLVTSHASLNGEPWVEVDGMWKLTSKITTDDTRAIRRGEDQIAMGNWPTAAAIFSGLADQGLSDVYQTFADKRAAESLLMSGDFMAALRYGKRALAAAPTAEDVVKLYDKIKMAVDTGGCPGCPPARGAVGASTTGGQVPWSGPMSGSGTPSTQPMSQPSGGGQMYSPPPPKSGTYQPTPSSSAPMAYSQPVVSRPAMAHSTPGAASSRPMASASSPRVIVPPPPPAPGTISPSSQPEKTGGSQEILDRPGRGY